ncbi:MAG: TetR/AcrR family transcriptional regulator [Micromonosporaceae bacterium]
MLQAALRYVDEHGLSALSMHKLGAELGVKGMSLYNHVPGKDGLLDGIVEAMWAEVPLPQETGTDWRRDVRALAQTLRDLVHRHPKAAPLLMSRPTMPTPALELLDRYLRRLTEGGLPQQRAVELMRTVYGYGIGFALAELTWMESDAAAPAGDDLRSFRHVTDLVPAGTPDHLVRTALLLCTGCDMAAQFDLGIDLMLRGVEAEKAPHRTSRRHQ